MHCILIDVERLLSSNYIVVINFREKKTYVQKLSSQNIEK